ncbi:hypothetical protein OYC64_015179 [Pagothenia borchgrevinki]|uniref:Uncharacterized protein n=1 Tax=Pagothenia borchgrevinki TaxID=8213 RepID=A0ABD2H3A5_PAGBO
MALTGSRSLQSNQATYSTRGMAVSTALFNGVSVEDICRVASWSTPGPFIRFYLLDMSGSFSSSVLAGATHDW